MYENYKYRIKEILNTKLNHEQRKDLVYSWIWATPPKLDIAVSTFYNYLNIKRGEKWEIPQRVLVTICKDLSEHTGEHYTPQSINRDLTKNLSI